MSHSLRPTPAISSLSGRPQSPDLTADAPPPRLQKNKPKRKLWDRSHLPTINSYLEGPHFSYDRTSAFNHSAPVTPESYQALLINTDFSSEININRNIGSLLSPAPLTPEELDDERRIVLSRDTSLVLELNFTPSPGHPLAFDALEIPHTRSVKYVIAQNGPHPLSLQILLMDALTNAVMQMDGGDQEKENESISPSLVDFRAEQNIIHLRDGKAVVRFTLPCCFLDSMHRTGLYRTCIALKLRGQQVMFQALHGLFEVAHVDNKLPERGLCYMKGLYITCGQPLGQPHNYYRITSDDGGRLFIPVIDGCFERVFSLVLRLGLNHVPLQNILASQNHLQRLYLLPLAKQRLLKSAIELEYYHIERMLTQACCDTATLRREYKFAVTLTCRVAPIHRLPTELFMNIFTFILDEQNPDNIDTLMRTRLDWKKIVTSMLAPLKLATWTSIDRVKDTLEGGNRPLLVTIDPSGDTKDRPIDSPESERYAALTLAVSSSISRWRTLDILSLPDPQQTSDLFGERRTTNPVPMNHLRSLNIRTRNDPSLFLDLLLPSIGAIASAQFTDMYLCSVQAISYLAQPHCAQVFTHLTSFKCFLPPMDGIIDILPRFSQLEILDVSCLCFPAYDSDVELPLTKTLRQMSLRAVPIGWMNHREFLCLESCTISSPPLRDIIPNASLPLCAEFRFEGPRFDVIKKFHTPTLWTLLLRSPQWSKSRGNHQLSHLWGAVPSKGGLRPTSLYLSIMCSSEQLLRALCFMPGLKELTLELDLPTTFGTCFFMGLLPLSSWATSSFKSPEDGAESLQVCPLLEVLRLKYRRWFHPGESNGLPALVAMAHFDNREPKLRIWVEKDEESVCVESTELSGSVLCSLGLLKMSDARQPQSEVAKEAIEAFLAILNPLRTKIYHPETMVQFSPSIYSCLFQRLREFGLYVDVVQAVLFKALAHFERLEVMYVRRIGPSSSKPHLPLFRTLKRLELGTTSLSWMDNCAFTKLEVLEIGNIDGDQLECIQMPICRSASFPRDISLNLLNAFKMPRLCDLVLSGQSAGLSDGCHNPSLQQFRLHTASLHFVNSLALKTTLELQPELETLEIRDLDFVSQPGKGLPDLLDMLMEPYKLNGSGGHNYSDCTTTSPRHESPLCPKLKELKLKLGLGQEWEWELECKQEHRRELERQQKLAGRLEQVLGKVQEEEYLLEVERVRERVRVLERKLKDVGGENQRTSQVQQCQKFMVRRMEKGYIVQRCQLVWVSGQLEIASESVELPYLDRADGESPGLGDILASWESHDP